MANDLAALLRAVEDRIQPEPMSGCWLWTGPVSNGYGILCDSGLRYLAHRLVYESVNGPIPDGHDAHHVCRVKSCVNPDHIRVLSAVEHLRLHNPPTTLCQRGHSMHDAHIRSTDGRRFCRVCRDEQIQRAHAKRDAIKAPEPRCPQCGKLFRAKPCGSPLHIPKARWKAAA